MHKIKEMLMNELYEYEDKAKQSVGGKISAGDLETIHKLTDTVKNIDKIEMLEEDCGYSEDGHYMGEGRVYGASYARNGRTGEYYNRCENGASYARRRHDSMGRYSREGAKEHMIAKMEEMLNMTDSEEERKALRQCIQKIENA